MSESSPKEGSEVAPEVLTDGVINVIDLDASCGQVQEAPPETPRKHTVGHARERRASISFSRSVSTSEIGGFMRSFGNGSQSTHRSSIRSKGGVPEGLERAVTMVRTYPIMSVEDTAFVNQIRRGSTGDSMEMSVSNMPDVSMGAIGEGEAGDPLGESTSNLYKTAELIRPITSAVALASRIKRACMWETVIVHFLSQRAWNETYRRNRLRAVLERHLLPVILRSRPDKSKPARFVRKTSNQPQKLTGKDAEQKAQSTFLMEHVPFFTALRSVRFCEAISEAVVRYRYVCGQAIVTPGLPSQNALYVLVSGMCDAIQSASETNPKVQRRRLKVGESFGGVLGGRAVFTELYRAISTCLVWVVTREDFESLFREYADAHMKSVFLQALKEHELERLQQIYPLPQCLSRVPIYRKSERLTQQLEQYMKGFSPIVKIKGDVLFSQGDPPGDIYCLVEGHVLREQVGPDMKYESGTRQILSPNEASNFLLSTRFVLLGEEPHVLQGLLRYRCTVVSRAALLYKIDSESFVNMLLDDAKLLIQLRKKHKEQLQQWMRLTPEALMQVPMLKDMPRSNLNASFRLQSREFWNGMLQFASLPSPYVKSSSLHKAMLEIHVSSTTFPLFPRLAPHRRARPWKRSPNQS
ncbi:hypothetical protein ERJ75_000321100 [Trypanosoma vivax]|nr:hypothetical protein ERJ75_000321100 [Trypanosoma vivax]